MLTPKLTAAFKELALVRHECSDQSIPGAAPAGEGYRCVGGAPAIQQIDLKTGTDVPGSAQEEFQDHAEQAKTSCIISRAPGGVGQINLLATLAP